MSGVITTSEPSWKTPFTGVSPRQFDKLITALRREGADPMRKGRPWSLLLEDRILLVAVYWRTNLTLRQLAPLFGVSKSAADRIITHLGPALALQQRKRFRDDTVLLVDGSLISTRGHKVAERSKTSHAAGGSSWRSGSEVHGRGEGTIGIEQRAVLQAVVEAAEQLVEQVPESCDVPFSASTPSVIVGAWSLRAGCVTVRGLCPTSC
ncbi:hypothetical protein GCM10010129_81270 [Streptomyces fumigatiscleroticus]|nr:hypothetical protein GCM10010129_81270 [Streptomyces fumigatiscleroticus]